MTDITDIIQSFRKYDSDLNPVTREEVGSDMIYRTLVKNMREVKKFNYHSDYWGSADGYQQAHIDFMEEVRPYIGKKVIIDGITGKLVGLLIDRQYNSLSHTDLLMEL